MGLAEWQVQYVLIFSFFGVPEALFVLVSYAAPQRKAYSEAPFQMAGHLRTGSPLKTGEIAGFEPEIAGLQSIVTTNAPPLPLLP
jgi:hypothetical protein